MSNPTVKGILDLKKQTENEATGCVVCRRPQPDEPTKTWYVGIFFPTRTVSLSLQGETVLGYLLCPTCFALPNHIDLAEKQIMDEMRTKS